MRRIYLSLIVCILGTLDAKIIDDSSIDINKEVIQLAVFKNYNQAEDFAMKYDKYDIFIEKVQNYTVYLVNQDKNNTKNTLNKIKKDFSDVFVIKKTMFFMDSNINNVIDEEEIQTANIKLK